MFVVPIMSWGHKWHPFGEMLETLLGAWALLTVMISVDFCLVQCQKVAVWHSVPLISFFLSRSEDVYTAE